MLYKAKLMSEFFQRNLPHYHLSNATYFITFRLAGSLPAEVWKKLKKEYELEKRWLAEPRFAEIAMRELHALHPNNYHLHAYCLMSNHCHMLLNQQDIPEPPPIDGKHYTAVSHAMRLLKGRTGYACAELLGRKGAFWQHESYDHVVRDEKEFMRILEYIVNNPVKAGLVENWQDWAYTYINPNLL